MATGRLAGLLTHLTKSGKDTLRPPLTERIYESRPRPHSACVDQGRGPVRELRHSFVSLLSDNGMPTDVISRMVGHSNTATTELIYRKKLRPVVQTGAVAMDHIFSGENDD